MKFTLSWLKDHLETDATLQQITDKLTDLGLEVESVIDRATELSAFTVAHVLTADQHPNADRLKLCTVDTGSETVQIVCGAPNAHAGMKGVFAASGTTIPGSGMVLKPTKIRGVESNGMLCSERELGLSDAHEGIIELSADAPVGTPFVDVMGLDDPIIEIAITPNRPDCLGVHGIARDLAAAGLGALKSGIVPPVSGEGACPIDIGLSFSLDTESACPMFAGRLVRGVKNGPSPEWMQRRLSAIGLRPISALVDITNYVSYDRGRPLHVYDADKLTGQIHARLGKEGEKLLALDGNEYAVADGACVIADESGVLGLAEIIGGEASGSADDTVNVFIESAYFDPIRTATTGRRLGIESDARYRFERGVDPEFVIPGLELATRMVIELCGGSASEIACAGAVPAAPVPVEFRPERVRQLTGMDVDDTRCVQILNSLGFDVASDISPMSVKAPSWRPDVHGEADLIEEVARVNGLDKLPVTPLPRVAGPAKALTLPQNRVRWGKRTLAARGMNEAVTWSFTAGSMAELFGGGAHELTLANPISSELGVMRPSLLPNLIAAAKRNADRGQESIALFEVGPQYAGDGPEDQATHATGIRQGARQGRHWAEASRSLDAFDVKADVLALLEAVGAPVSKLQQTNEAPDWYHPGRSGAFRLGPKNVLGHFGELHPKILEMFDLRGPLLGFEVNLTAVPLPKAGGNRSRGPLRASDLQPVTRDFAFVMDVDVPADQVVRAASGASPLVNAVSVFDVYEGEHVGAGTKSLAIAVTLQPRDKTLTDAEIEDIAAQIITGVEKASGGKLRQ